MPTISIVSLIRSICNSYIMPHMCFRSLKKYQKNFTPIKYEFYWINKKKISHLINLRFLNSFIKRTCLAFNNNSKPKCVVYLQMLLKIGNEKKHLPCLANILYNCKIYCFDNFIDINIPVMRFLQEIDSKGHVITFCSHCTATLWKLLVVEFTLTLCSL